MSSTAPAQDKWRLPTDVKAKHYDVTVQTDLEASTFEGFVTITLDVQSETSTIVLNADALELGSASVTSSALPDALKPTDQSFDAATKRLTLALPSALPANSQAFVTISYKAPLGDSMTGYYRSSWKAEGSSDTKYYTLTQFEATDARRAFPCWDEPALKSTFSVTMISRADTVNLSNMPATSEEAYTADAFPEIQKHLPSFKPADESWKITKFEKTPIMSSYLVAYANGPFKHVETSVKMPLSGKDIPLRVYTTPEHIHQAEFALEVKAKVLPLYEKVFDVEFPLPKLDTLVASDFDAGAMENWGLITGRTTAFLLDPKKADIAARKYVVNVQSHEVAHMWFGNITTMAWWDYLYLNEGFATLMGEVIIPDMAFPEFKANSEFISDHLNRALALDAKVSSHPIEVACPNPDDVGQIFDALSYSKAGSVLRMLAAYVGVEKFLKGVSLYLKAHLYSNTVSKDLWVGVSKATGLDIVAMMENWITKIGFPVLTVTETKDGITVKQDRFLESGPAEKKDNETLWNIPLAIVTTDANGKASLDNEAILTEREKTFKIDTSKPFKINGGTTGVYRVLYTPERLSAIAKEAAKENSVFSMDDRLGLIHDSFALSKAGLAKLSSALNLVDILKNEQEYLAWSSISENISGLSGIWWENAELSDDLDEFRRSLFVPIVKKLGYEYADSDSPDTKQLRTIAIAHAASAQDPDVLAELRRRFDVLLKTGEDTIPADLIRTTYAVAVKYGGEAEYNYVHNLVAHAPNPSVGGAARSAVGATRDPALLKRTFGLTLSGLRDQDVPSVFASLAGNKLARRDLNAFFQENYDTFYERFQHNSILRYLVPISCQSLTTKQDYESVKSFFGGKDSSKYHMPLNQALESIESRRVYIERSTDDLRSWLTAWKQQ